MSRTIVIFLHLRMFWTLLAPVQSSERGLVWPPVAAFGCTFQRANEIEGKSKIIVLKKLTKFGGFFGLTNVNFRLSFGILWFINGKSFQMIYDLLCLLGNFLTHCHNGNIFISSTVIFSRENLFFWLIWIRLSKL